jgi:hypothetical protein
MGTLSVVLTTFEQYSGNPQSDQLLCLISVILLLIDFLIVVHLLLVCYRWHVSFRETSVSGHLCGLTHSPS